MAKPKTKSVKKMTKGALILSVLESMGEGWTRKDVVKVLDALSEIGHNELKKKGEFVFPGFAEIRAGEEAGKTCSPGHQSFHQRANNLCC